MAAAERRRAPSGRVSADMVTSFGVPVVMRDGLRLAADVSRPGDDASHPCLLQRVPYDRSLPAIVNSSLDVVRAVRRGYGVVTQDCRGRYGSEGDFEPFVHEADDGEDTVAWLAEQPWCDGNVGMFGRSYSGMVQWLAASRLPPGLKAIVPMLSGADPFRDWFAPTGIIEWGFAISWGVRYLAPDVLARAGWPVSRDEVLAIIDDLGTLFAETDGDERLSRLAEHLPYLRAWLNEDASGCRELAALATDPADVDMPVFVIAGWFDIFLQGCLRSYRRLREADGTPPPDGRRQLLIGPWPHGSTNSGVFPERSFGIRASEGAIGLTDMQLDFFDRWLREVPAGPSRPPVRYFVTGTDEWCDGDRWPPSGTRLLTIDLGADEDPAAPALGVQPAARALRVQPASTGTARVDLVFDEAAPVPTCGGQTFLPGLEVSANAGPRDLRRFVGRADVIAMFGDVLAAPVEAVGDVMLRIQLAEGPPGVSLVGRLVEGMADGSVMLLAEGAGRLADEAPSGAGAIDVMMPPIAHRFAAGSRIGLLVSATSHPRYRRWVSSRRPEAPRRGTLALALGHTSTSRLWLNVGATT